MTSSAAPRRPALIALVVLSLIWSYNWIVMKQALAYAGPITFSAWRYGLGCIVLFALLAARRESLRPPPLLPTVCIGLAQTTGFQLLVQAALLAGGAGRTALLAYTMPFWVVLLGWLAFGERPTRQLWCGLAVAAAGLLLVLEPWRPAGNAASTTMALAGGFAYQGETYKSLSEIAVLITGTRWNGPRFFGLRPSAKSAPQDEPETRAAPARKRGRPAKIASPASDPIVWPGRPTPDAQPGDRAGRAPKAPRRGANHAK